MIRGYLPEGSSSHFGGVVAKGRHLKSSMKMVKNSMKRWSLAVTLVLMTGSGPCFE